MAKRKKRIVNKVFKLLFIFGIAATVTWFLTTVIFKPTFVHYPAFGIDIPVNYSLHGIDVSKYQQTIAWKEVKDMTVNDVKLDFVFIKATEGLGKIDDQFRRNWVFAEKQGLTKGAYHFFIATKSGKIQALNFVETVQLKKGDLPPVLDIEQTFGASSAALQQNAKVWLEEIEKIFSVKPIIYTNVDFYNRYLAGKFDDYPLWIAHYLVKDKPRIKRSWIFWQHSESGHVNGIEPYVDFNVFNGDSTDFERLKIK
ncbi:MAG: GH25 family lysozyme [Ferruginibacter sp.]